MLKHKKVSNILLGIVDISHQIENIKVNIFFNRQYDSFYYCSTDVITVPRTVELNRLMLSQEKRS